MQEIFSFQRTRIDETGKVRGRFLFSGVRPRFIDRFKLAGIEIPREAFNPEQANEV
jgi:pilus assembly protein CpaF